MDSIPDSCENNILAKDKVLYNYEDLTYYNDLGKDKTQQEHFYIKKMEMDKPKSVEYSKRKMSYM
jgi:hypothetical protein